MSETVIRLLTTNMQNQEIKERRDGVWEENTYILEVVGFFSWVNKLADSQERCLSALEHVPGIIKKKNQLFIYFLKNLENLTVECA